MEENIKKKYPLAFSRSRPSHARCDAFSLRHPKMPLGQRAKIFSPFAALRGFEEAIDSKRKLYVEKRELNEEEQEAIAEALKRLHTLTRNSRAAKAHPVSAHVRYYVPCADEYHEAYGCRGSYETVSGAVWKVDPLCSNTIWIEDRKIALADLAEITILSDEVN